jgi:heme-degrading monooxygenase HmoA
MFIVIFEVQPRKEHRNDYLELAKQLKPKLEATEGFIDNERFDSKRTVGRVLSLSTWRDEKAVVRWRTQGEHHDAQEQGRFAVFEDYHLRVGEITADSAPPKGLSIEEKRFDETELGRAKCCTIIEASRHGDTDAALMPERTLERLQLDAHADGLVDHETFESLYNPGKVAILAAWRDASSAKAWRPVPFDGVGQIRHRQVRIIRDYGMFDRREAPQFYPAVRKASAG